MMSTQRVHVVQEFNAPIANVFATLSEHENLNQIFFPAKIKRLTNGQGARNGVGSSRQMMIPLSPSFVETNTFYEENQRIEYKITSGISPIKDHLGVMQFTDLGNGRTRLEYTITFKGRLPLVGMLVKLALQDGITRGLKKIKF